MGSLVEFKNVTKKFGGTIALNSVSLALAPGEILALLGENGAGKSTLIKCMAAIHSVDEGNILFKGERYDHRPPKPNEKQKVAFIHQDLGLIEWMSVGENVGLAQGFSRNGPFINWPATESRAKEALALVGCDFDPSMRVSDLSRTEKSLVAIARAISAEADVLVLDEPTASLPANEVERLFSVLRSLRSKGVGMIYVSHRLDEIFRIADRVAVLRDGSLVSDKLVGETSPQELVGLIVGREVKDLYFRSAATDSTVTLAVNDLRIDSVGPVNFAAHRGEVLGLVGLRGAGQESVGRALFGAVEYGGNVLINDRHVSLSTPEVALQHGIGLIARDRSEESVALPLSVKENMFLNPKATGRRLLSFLRPSVEYNRTATIGGDVGLRPNDPNLPIEALSGGNQQKVVVGRWLATARKVLIAEDPTAGVDVGAKSEIYRLFGSALENGLTVIVVSTDFEEVAHICHRALVFSRGTVVAELAGDALSTHALIHAASASEAA